MYVEHCLVCHRADGLGVPRIFPSLAGNSAIVAKNPQSVIQITLEGGKMPSNDVDAMDYAMPAFNYLSNEDLVAVINFIRNGWQNQAPKVTAKEVQHIRDFLASKSPNLIPDPQLTSDQAEAPASAQATESIPHPAQGGADE